MRWTAAALPALSLLAALAGGSVASAADDCVTACEQKTNQCAARCEELSEVASDDPASLRDCQLACARGLFVSCFELCAESNVVVEDDYGLVAPYTKDAPLPAGE